MGGAGSWVSVSLQLSKFTKHTAKRDQIGISFHFPYNMGCQTAPDFSDCYSKIIMNP